MVARGSKKYAVYLDSFSSADEKNSRGGYINENYISVKAAVLRAGKFSSFEASDRPGIYTCFFGDPELEVTTLDYPWHGVRLRDKGEQGG